MPVISITSSKNILTVINAYNQSRQSLSSDSMILENIRPESEPGLLKQIGVNAANGAINAGANAAVGAALGGNGVVAATALAAVHAGLNALSSWANTEETITVNLQYLKPITFIENNNLPEGMLQDLQERYDSVLRYQKLKMSRGLFLGLGKNYKDDLVDDPKYLVAILLGHIIEEAAQAASKQDYQNRIEQLTIFLQSIAEHEELLVSNSNDTAYLSLRTLIIWLKERETKSQEATEKSETNRQRLEKLLENLDAIFFECTNIHYNNWEMMLATSTEYHSYDFEQYQSHHNDPLRKNDTHIQALRKDRAFQALFKYHTEQKEISAKSLKHILATAANINANAIDKQTINAFSELLSANAKLQQLRMITRKISKLDIISLSRMISDLRFVLSELKNAVMDTEIKRKKFVNVELKKIYLLSTSIEFKNNYTKYAFTKPELTIFNQINEADFLTNIVANIEDIENKVTSDLNHQVDALQKEIRKLRPANPQSTTQLEQSIATLEAADKSFFDEFMSDAVMVEIESALKKGTEVRIPEAVEQQLSEPSHTRWLHNIVDLFNYHNRNKEIRSLNEQVAYLSNKLGDKTVEFKNKYKKIKNENEKAVSKNRLLTAQIKLNTMKNEFNNLIEDYLAHTKSGFAGFFSAHGNKGRQTANEFARLFNHAMNISMEEIKRGAANKTIESMEDAVKILADKFKELVIQASDSLTGNYKCHSLKTYLLAYHAYLSSYCNKDVEHTDALTFYQVTFEKADPTDIFAAYQQQFTNPADVERDARNMRNNAAHGHV